MQISKEGVYAEVEVTLNSSSLTLRFLSDSVSCVLR